MNLPILQDEVYAMAKETSLESLRPSDTPAYMTQAWVDCLIFAINQPEIVAQFREESGNNYSVGRTPIERMIDDATGRTQQFIVEFVKWANINVWGPLEAPHEPS